uniref:Uncharacterized protein n=1 Tax=Podoviridae sp. cti6G1 TaxID=2826570 RepID=A0A8S5LUW6_9CAUD|nr:MAG TPA: hypothetical protein [Podoviridae sp. cti6G1]
MDDATSPHPSGWCNPLIFPKTSIGGSRTARTPPKKKKPALETHGLLGTGNHVWNHIIEF